MIRSARTLLLPVLFVGMTVSACSDDDGTGPEVLRVTLQGTVQTSEGEGVPDVFAHFVTGSTATARGLSVAETGADGSFVLQADVPEDECRSLQVWVLESEAFLASSQRLAREVIGTCSPPGPVTLVVVEGGGPP